MLWIKALWRDESGATSIEYAVIGFFASILIVGGAFAIGNKLNVRFAPIAANLT